jgi:predicted transcriptional regulator YdeE
MLFRSLLTVLCLGVLVSASQTAKDAPLKPIHEDSFYVAGYEIRTNNAREMSGQGEIGKLWQKVMQENLVAQIPNRTDSALIVVYSGYASDEKGDFNYLLGARVSSVDKLPAGMTYRKLEPGPYAIFITDQGPLVELLQAEWKKIWTMPPEQMGGKRAFLTDYEVYDQRSADQSHAQIEIHIGLKPVQPLVRPRKDAEGVSYESKK